MPSLGKKVVRLRACALAQQHAREPTRTHENLPGVTRRQPCRHRQPVLRILASQRLHGQIEGDHERRAAGLARTRDQRLVEAAISHQVQLEPEVALYRGAHVFDGTDRHGAQAEGHAGALRGACGLDLTIAMEKPVRPVGARPRQVHFSPSTVVFSEICDTSPMTRWRSCSRRKSRDCDSRSVVIGAAIDVIEQRARNA